MDWLYYYTTFALSGALLTWWVIFRPSIQLLAYETEGKHPMLNNQILSGVVWISLATAVIPILVYPILNDKVRINFIIGLTQGFLNRRSKK
jgi:hypothetical protein